ncbi:MAG: hypothetical protein Rubg2KO_10660 [Rubricoccaceae bacterium]
MERVLHRLDDRPGLARSRGCPKKGAVAENAACAGEPADHALGRSRGGFTTKLHLVTDRRGLPLAIVLTPGQRNDSTQFEAVLDAVAVRQRSGQTRRRPIRVLADRGYDADRIRAWLRRRGIGAVIPPKKNRTRRLRYDRALYRERNVVERSLGHLKEHRRIGTRHEKLAQSYRAMVQLAMIERYLREYPDRA